MSLGTMAVDVNLIFRVENFVILFRLIMEIFKFQFQCRGFDASGTINDSSTKHFYYSKYVKTEVERTGISWDY
jgi:hypothetical protein